uniref:JmjC domain-containing protein n=1 Tax=Caenorhabditis tropicalis TaxID=1561998 RepID=A0A1I7V3X4_9PELO
MSIVKMLEGPLKSMEEEIKEELRQKIASLKRKELKKEMERIEKFRMPIYQKNFLISMKGSFTNIHVDFSVINLPSNGQKEEKEKDKWIGDMLFDQWKRVEINPGETLMMPSGYLHSDGFAEPGLEVDLHRMQLDRLLDRWEHCKRADKSAGYEEYGTACSSGV